MRLPILLILIISSSTVHAEVFKEKALWKVSTYYCKGNPSFLQCIKPQVLSDLQGCVTYVVQNTTNCSDKYLNNREGLSETEQINNAIEFTQCSLMEMLASEDIKESEFEQCFNEQISGK